jgi:hypothetical protein
MAQEWISAETQALLRFLDLTIEASALVFDIHPDIAGFAMMAALVAAEELGISDSAAYHMRDSVLLELKRRSADPGH